jgi:hypothetical protein
MPVQIREKLERTVLIKPVVLMISVSDPDSLSPDPGFFGESESRIQIQVFDDQN